jgi:hypothetical protein
VGAVFLGFAAAAAWIVVQVVRGGDGPPPWFAAVWLAILGWNAYWWVFRICTEVRVEAGRLAWRTPLRRGEVPLTDVTRIRPSRAGQRQTAVVELRGHRPLLVPVRYGFERLSRALTDAVPGLRVDA